jgi:hypothetical protein
VDARRAERAARAKAAELRQRAEADDAARVRLERQKRMANMSAERTRKHWQRRAVALGVGGARVA